MTDEPREMRLRYAGLCVRCGAVLSKGQQAIYDPTSHTVRCLVCASETPAPNDMANVDVGVAGRSAKLEFERRHSMRAERVKQRFGRRLGGVVLALSSDPQSTEAWERGAEGERELAKALASVAEVRVLNDRQVHGTRGNIDHIVIAPAGVFVVDAKDHGGQVHTVDRGGLFRTDLRLYVGRRDCSRLADNMTWQVDAVAAFLKSIDAGEIPVTPVLCFVRAEWPVFSPPESFRGVRIEGKRSIKRLVTSGSVLTAEARDLMAAQLARAFPAK